MMNVENILKVADAIEQHAFATLGFNMGLFKGVRGELPDHSGHKCGTTACIAGWAEAVRVGNARINNDYLIDQRAAEFLGLNTEDSFNLFFGRSPAPLALDEIKQGDAVAVLRHLAATGKVDWSIASQSLPSEGEV